MFRRFLWWVMGASSRPSARHHRQPPSNHDDTPSAARSRYTLLHAPGVNASTSRSAAINDTI
ncbi:hypothetical protein ACQEVF_57965 [Nonomuraea polychroma]|uniref:hypothetical protein n=1 Tax=Nonomuraea polychroma TaxID=46176 RepID=UPI003D92084B